MFFDHEGKHYRLMFRYGVDKHEHRTVTASVQERATVTTTDGVAEGWVRVAEDKSRTNPLDRFLKEDGRLIALKRVAAGLDRDMRGKVLNAYYNRRKMVRK